MINARLPVGESFWRQWKVHSQPGLLVRRRFAWKTPRNGPGGSDGDGRAERRDRKNAEDSAETPAESQERAADKRADDAAEAAHAQHPADAGGAGDGRIAAWGEGVEAGLRPTRAEARGEDQGGEPVGLRPDPCKPQDEDGARQIRGADNPGWMSPIHAPSDYDRADRGA